MIQINPLKSYIDGGVRAALTTPPSASLVFDLPGKAIWVKGVKLKGTDHTYTFSHDNYITLTNTPDSNESEDIKIGVNTSALKSAIDTTYGVVSTTANGLAPKFTSGNKLAAAAATTYYFLGWAGTTLKWYQAPFRNVRINSETTDCLGVNNTDPLIISSGNGISVTWDSTNKKIIITNTKPDVNHNTDTKVALSVTTLNKNYAIILKGNDSDEGSITTVNFSTYLKFNPSTKQLTINGNKVITTIDTFVGATTSADGSVGLVTKPLIANRLLFLRGDGTWATPIDTWRPVKVEGTEKLGSNALDLSAGNGISIVYNSDTKKIIITNTKPDVNHNTHYTTMLYIGENNDTKANKNVANPYLKLFDDNARRATFQIKAGNGIAVASDANGNITITNSSPDVNHNTDISVKQTPKTDNINRPLMMINGSTSTGEQINTSMFSTGIYANASTKMITANGFIKAGSSNSYVLLGGGGHKVVSDFATSGHNHDGRYVYNYGGTQMDGASINKNALGMTTSSGITGDWWHILQAAWNGEYRWNSLIAFPTLNRNGVYYRSGLDNNTAWGAWVKLLDVNNYSSILDSRYYTESEINTKLGAYLPLAGGTMTGNLSFSNSGTGFRGINYGTMGDNDLWRIGGAATGSNGGYMEIATADDGNEPIYVRQYTGVFSSVKRTLTLLDANGYTHFPSYINIGGNENNNSSPDRVWGSNGSDSYLRSYRTSALHVANADTVDGYHETAFPRLVGIKGNTWNWNDVIRAGYYKIQSGTITNHPSGIYPFGMAEVITTENHNDGENRELQIYYPHSQTNNIAIWLRTHNSSTQGNGWGSWVGVPNINGNIASASKLQTARSIWGHSFNGTADVNGTIYINNSNSSEGAIRLNNNVNSNARISAIDSQVIFNTDAAIRFGGTSWDWNVWAGLKYNHSNKTIYLGLADGSIFNANSALSGGSLRFPGVSTVYAITFSGTLSGNASSATKLTSSAGNATLPIYFSDGKPVACTASSVFSNLSNSGNNISVTVAGLNRTLTVGYADTVDGYHASNIMQAGWIGLMRTGGSASTIKWTRIGRFITTSGDNVNNDAMIEFFSNGDQNYTYFGHGRLMLSSYGTGSSNMMLTSVSDGSIHFYATIDANRYIWLGHNAWWTGNSKYRVLFTGSFVEWYSSSLTMQTTNPNNNYITDNGTFKYNAAMSTASSGSSHSWVWQYNSRVAYASSAGNADTVDGLHVHSGRNNEVNKIVRTDASGYILAGWINTTSGDMGTTAINKIYCSNDSYIRYKTPANFFSTLANSGNNISITVAGQNRTLTIAYASNADTVDNKHASDFATADRGVWPIRIYNIALKPTTSWTDTSINSSTTYFPDGEGTYMIFLNPNHSNGTDGWVPRYAGYFVLYTGTNGSETEELLLQAASHASYKRLFLRWINTPNTLGYRKLLIRSESNYSTSYTMIFKFRRII